jgi:hypothetical protein
MMQNISHVIYIKVVCKLSITASLCPPTTGTLTAVAVTAMVLSPNIFLVSNQFHLFFSISVVLERIAWNRVAEIGYL